LDGSATAMICWYASDEPITGSGATNQSRDGKSMPDHPSVRSNCEN
jgi:hypothetical protein